MYVSAVKAVADVQNLSIQFPILNKDLDVFHNFDVTCKNDEKNWLQTNPLWIERCFEYWGLVLVSVYGGYSFLKSIGYMS